MSDPVDVTPSVKKQTKRFAPVKRGAKTASTSRPEPTKTESEPPKSTTIGNLRPESVSSGRLQSVNEKKTRGSSIKMKFKPTVPLKRNKKEVYVLFQQTKNKKKNFFFNLLYLVQLLLLTKH